MKPPEIITSLREKLSVIWNECQDDPELGRDRLGMWKGSAEEAIRTFSPERADHFWEHCYGKPYTEIEDEAERLRKIFQSEVETYDRFLVALLRHYEDFPILPTGDGAGKRSAVETALSDKQTMCQYYKYYSIKTAKDLIEAIPKAWDRWSLEEEGRWGPGQIAEVYNLHPTTIGRYLKAFKAIGLTEIDGAPIP